MAWIHDVPPIEFDGNARFTVYGTGDWQLGSKSASGGYVKSWISRVSKDPNGIVGFFGDLQDCDRPTTRSIKRAAFSERTEVLLEESEHRIRIIEKEIIPLIRPLAEMRLPMLGMLAGHHYQDLYTEVDNRLEKQTSMAYICKRLTELTGREVPYLGIMSAWVNLYFRKTGIKVTVKKTFHIQHGTGGGAGIAYALNRLQKTAQGFYADAYIRAHDCQQVSARICVAHPAGSGKKARVKHREIVLLNIGSATTTPIITRGDPDYAENGMMNPLPRGWGKVHIDLRKASRLDDQNQSFYGSMHVEL